MKSFMNNVKGFIVKRWYVVLILAIGIGLYFYQNTTAQAKKIQESSYTIERRDIKETLSLAGDIRADEHVVLRFQTSGRLSWVGVKEGDTVKKFQTVASLDQRELKKRLEKSLLTYAQTRNSFEQTDDDNQRVGDQPNNDIGNKMKRLLENSQYGLNSSVLDVEITNLALEYSNLFTPIEGVVIRADAKYAGVNITPSQAEFEIVNPDTLYFSFLADQTEVTLLSEELNGEMQFDSFPEDTLTGSIYYLSFTPRQGETGTVYEGRIRLPVDAIQQYRLGMTGDVTFTLREKNNVVVVQETFTRTEGEKRYVTKLENGVEKKTYIKTGLESDGYVEILSGLKEGDVVIK